jgi:hypothetical protein
VTPRAAVAGDRGASFGEARVAIVNIRSIVPS